MGVQRSWSPGSAGILPASFSRNSSQARCLRSQGTRTLLLFGARGDFHFCGAQQPVADLITALELLNHGILFVLVGRFRSHGFVNVRVEGLPDRFNRFQSKSRERIYEL